MIDRSLTQSVIEILQRQRVAIEEALGHLRPLLNSVESLVAPSENRRRMSAAGRRSIAEAQRKRWAIYHAAEKEVTRKRAKRTMSAEGRSKISQANKKRWRAWRRAMKRSK